MPLLVNEIFHSIQGESSFTGKPCVFIRLTGCNAQCSYCDTQYAFTEGELMEIPQILEMVQSCNCPLVEVTGGEPLLQEETPRLITSLLELGLTVLLETNGSQDISRVDERCIQIVDMKCPSSGMSKNNDYQNLKRLRPHDELKFVLGDRQDYLWAKSLLDQVPGYPDTTRNIFFSTVFDKLAPAEVAEWILADRLNVRLQLQLHKYVWDPEMKGV